MPRTEWGWLVAPEELESWILYQDADLLAIDKPAHVVCHPSKHGPWSSLIGACREFTGAARLHLPSRLDRETSGVVVVVRHAGLASRLQRAIARGGIRKIYYAILTGELKEAVTVDQPLGKAQGSVIEVRRGVVEGGAPSVTRFEPLAGGRGFTLARIIPETGRMHQIRAHAAWLGHAVAGDKVYGPDERLFIEFFQHGWTARHEELLVIERQALHASEWECREENLRFTAPLPGDWTALLDRAEIVLPFKVY